VIGQAGIKNLRTISNNLQYVPARPLAPHRVRLIERCLRTRLLYTAKIQHACRAPVFANAATITYGQNPGATATGYFCLHIIAVEFTTAWAPHACSVLVVCNSSRVRKCRSIRRTRCGRATARVAITSCLKIF